MKFRVYNKPLKRYIDLENVYLNSDGEAFIITGKRPVKLDRGSYIVEFLTDYDAEEIKIIDNIHSEAEE
jgi:hypothetical protein